MADDKEVNTAAPLDLHPQMIAAMEVDGKTVVTEAMLPFVQSAIDAFQDATDGLGQINDVRKAALADGTLTDNARALAVADFADTRSQRILTQLDSAYKTVTANIAHAEKTLTAPLEATTHSQSAQEIRAIVLKMNEAQRNKTIMDAISSNDSAVLSAVLAVHPMQSGLTHEQRALYTRTFREKNQPEMMARLTVLTNVQRMIEVAGGKVMKHTEKLIGVPRAQLQELRANNKRLKTALSK